MCLLLSVQVFAVLDILNEGDITWHIIRNVKTDHK